MIIHMTHFRRRMACAAALVVAATAVAASSAVAALAPDSSSGISSVVVAHRDLNLAQPEGRAALQGRLRAAARLVCGAPEREDVRAHFARQACYQEAIAQAVRDVDG